MRTLLPAAILFAAAATPAQAETRSFAVGAFDRVAASGSADVFMTTGQATAVVAEGPKERLDRLVVEVVDGELRLREQGQGSWDWGRNQGLVIRVSGPAVRAASTAGSGTMTVERGAGDRFEGRVSGSGELKVGRVDAPSVAVSVSGSGDATIGGISAREARFAISGSGDIRALGSAGQVTAAVSGSGDAKLGELRAQDLTARLAGSGNLDGFATGTANLSVAGSANALVRGGARCTISKSPGASARCEP